MRGLFVTGTGTGVGKTVLSAALLLRFPEARYWKPIQTGTACPDGDDTAEVLRLSGSAPSAAYHHGVRLPDPVSPHLAAKRQGIRIDLGFHASSVKESADKWIVEGAGGVLVPINERDLMIHFMERLGLPVLIAARAELGTINHTLLTIEALRARRLIIAGVVMIGEPNADNRAAIEHYGSVAVVAEMPAFNPLTHESLRAWAAGSFDALQEFFQ